MILHMRKLVQDSKQNVFHVAETSNEVRPASKTVNKHAENISSTISEINTCISLQKKEAGECLEKLDIFTNLSIDSGVTERLLLGERLSQSAESNHGQNSFHGIPQRIQDEFRHLINPFGTFL